MSLVLNNQKILTPGLETISWLDDPKTPQATDTSPRTLWIRAIVIHTVHGRSGKLLPGSKPSTRAESFARYQSNTPRNVSWDYTVDTDGTIIVSNDPIRRYTWHAGSVNPFTIGIEMVQDNDGSLYKAQMETMVQFLDTLTRALADHGHPIQRQIPIDKSNQPVRKTIPRILNPTQARNVIGIYGHRNQTRDRGPGDPGDHVFHYLLQAGYKGFNLNDNEDIAFWKSIQKSLGLKEDGTPGRDTHQALLSSGKPHGMMFPRPGD